MELMWAGFERLNAGGFLKSRMTGVGVVEERIFACSLGLIISL